MLNAVKPLLHYMLGYKLNQLRDACWSAIFVIQIGQDDYAPSGTNPNDKNVSL
jgi:hypothetical protein